MKVKNSRTRNMLRYLALAGSIALVSLAAPMLPYQLLKSYTRARRFERKRFLEDVKRLQRRNLVSVQQHTDGTVELSLQKEGERVALRYNFDELKIARPRRWDGTWRLVMFDVPQNLSRARDALRMKLRDLGFHQLQKSVFLFPFPCEKEIDALAAFWGLGDFILILHVSGFEGEEKLLRRFCLSRR